MEAAADGGIIPVNALDSDKQLTIWWFKEVTAPNDNFASFHVPAGDILHPLLGLADLARRLFRVTILRPAEASKTIPVFLEDQWSRYQSTILQRMARQESFALGVLLMTGIALGLAFIVFFH